MTIATIATDNTVFRDASGNVQIVYAGDEIDPTFTLWVAPVVSETEKLAASWKAYQTQAKAALDASDITVLRCVEKAVSVPTAWATYRATLRAIVGATTVGDPTKPLPTKPSYPAGT